MHCSSGEACEWPATSGGLEEGGRGCVRDFGGSSSVGDLEGGEGLEDFRDDELFFRVFLGRRGFVVFGLALIPES